MQKVAPAPPSETFCFWCQAKFLTSAEFDLLLFIKSQFCRSKFEWRDFCKNSG